MIAAVRGAFALLTSLPVRAAPPRDRDAAGRALALAPLVGLVLGLVTAVVVVILRLWINSGPGRGAQSVLPAVVGIALLAFLTGARHLAGLAVVADALAARGSRGTRGDQPAANASPASTQPGRTPAVDRPFTVGPTGVAAMLFVVLIQSMALNTAIQAHRGTVSIIVSCVAGRLAITLACARRPARVRRAADGAPASTPTPTPTAAATTTTSWRPPSPRDPSDWFGGLVVDTVPPRLAALVALAAIGLAAVAGRLDYDGGDVGRAIRAVVALAVAIGVAALIRRALTRRLGELTEPALGALVELTATVALVTMAMTVPDQIMNSVGLS